MKLPLDVQQKISELGQQVVSNESPNEDFTMADATDELATYVKSKSLVLADDVLRRWARDRISAWVYQQMRQPIEDKLSGQVAIPFSELPAHLEVSPGRFVHQTVMTGRDWDNALAIYRNRRDQADVSFRQFERIYDRIRPLLKGDLTTKDVMEGPAEAASK